MSVCECVLLLYRLLPLRVTLRNHGPYGDLYGQVAVFTFIVLHVPIHETHIPRWRLRCLLFMILAACRGLIGVRDRGSALDATRVYLHLLPTQIREKIRLLPRA